MFQPKVGAPPIPLFSRSSKLRSTDVVAGVDAAILASPAKDSKIGAWNSILPFFHVKGAAESTTPRGSHYHSYNASRPEVSSSYMEHWRYNADFTLIYQGLIAVGITFRCILAYF